MSAHTAPADYRQDALGEPVHVGDVVAYASGGSSKMRFGKVISLTKQGVRLLNFTQGGNPQAPTVRSRQPVREEITKQPEQILLIRANENYKAVPGSMLRDLFPNNH